MKRSKPKSISLVIPCFNEAESLPLLVKELLPVIKKDLSGSHVEVLFIDDGSTDNTLIVLKELHSLLPHRVIALSRNFGHQAALYAGMTQAKGEVVVTLDADLQHPPSLIPQLLKAYQGGADIVQTQRVSDQQLPLLKVWSSKLFYLVVNHLSPTSITTSGSDYRLVSRPVLDTILSLPEQRVFLRGLIHWVGFSLTTIPYHAQARLKGESKYNLIKMLTLAIHGITSFSSIPLYMGVLMAGLFSVATLVYAGYVVYVWLWSPKVVEGWSSVILVVLGLGSVMSLLLAIIGMYLAAVFEEVKHRPIYIIKPSGK